MNIKKRIPKFMAWMLSFTMAFSSMIPAYAMETANSMIVIDGEKVSREESNFEDITVTYKQASSFFVTIPKTIVLDGWKQSAYVVKVSGDIDAEQCVYVAPVDTISRTENIDFYMKDQASVNAKTDVVANVTHNKFHWNSVEVAEGYEQNDNLVSAPDLTAGEWRGVFQMEIKLETHTTHKHNYVETITKEPTCTEIGIKAYTCECGASYTEEIPAKGHHYVDGECEHCHEKDPDYHIHSYDDGVVTKEPTCTEKGEKTFTCSSCGHTYTEEIPAKEHHYGNDDKCTECGQLNPDHKHNYVDGGCSICGDKCPHDYINGTCTICGKTIGQYYTAPASAYLNWDYTLDDKNNIITLNYYKGSETNVIVYANYVIEGKTYKTQLASNVENAIYSTPYMFNGSAQTTCKNIKSITYSEDIDTSNVTNMSYMFSNCQSLTNLNISKWDTSKVTNMKNMFYWCRALSTLNVSSFDTRNVTNMSNMFMSCQSLTNLDISNFDTGNVTNMSGMFNLCILLSSLNLNNFDTSNVTDMSYIFADCYKLASLDISSFDTRKVTNMGNMFAGCKALTSLGVSSFNTCKVTDMHNMFFNCLSLGNLNVSNFNTSNVTDMSSMFRECKSLITLDLRSFDTSKVTNTNYMFYNCSKLKTIYALSSKWTTSQATTTNIFSGCGTSSVTYK